MMSNNWIIGLCCFGSFGLILACLPNLMTPTQDYLNEQLQLVTTTTITTTTTTTTTTSSLSIDSFSTTTVDLSAFSPLESEVTSYVDET